MPQYDNMKKMQQDARQQNQFGQLLSSLLQTASQQRAQMSTVESDISANQQRASGQVQQEPADMIKQQAKTQQALIGADPIMSATHKAVQDSIKKLVPEALMAGASYQDILKNAEQMSGFGQKLGQQSSQDMAPLLQSLLSMAQQPKQQALQENGMTDIQQQASDASQPVQKRNAIQMLTGFGSPGNELYQEKMKSMRLDNLGKSQKIMGQEPIQPYQQLSQDIEMVKANAANQLSRYSAISGQENKISEQYTKDFEPLKLATDSVGKITSIYEDSLKNPNNNVNDFFLVYNAIKAADPTAVKEGEYKTVQELMPLASKILNGVNFKLKGETLNPAQRARIVRAAVTQYNGLAKRFEPLAKQYEERVTFYGGDPKRALINYGAQGKSSFKVTEIKE